MGFWESDGRSISRRIVETVEAEMKGSVGGCLWWELFRFHPHGPLLGSGGSARPFLQMLGKVKIGNGERK